MRWMWVAAIALAIFTGSACAQTISAECPTPLGANGEWTIDVIVISSGLACKYETSMPSAEWDGVCPATFTSRAGNVWVLTVEKLNNAGRLVCKYVDIAALLRVSGARPHPLPPETSPPAPLPRRGEQEHRWRVA